jgi:hypothetical protein
MKMKHHHFVLALCLLGCGGSSMDDHMAMNSPDSSTATDGVHTPGMLRDSDVGHQGGQSAQAGSDASASHDAGHSPGDNPRDASVMLDAGAPRDGGSSKDSGAQDSGTGGPHTEVTLPPFNSDFDYQLGGAYTPAASVKIVSRDRLEQPMAGLYNICYVNGFQVQADEKDVWLSDHADLVLRDDSGDPVIDADWDEMLVDVSSADKRARLSDIVGGWIAGCAQDGFDAVEIDNLDSYSRSGGRLTQDNAVAFISLLSAKAHASKLAIAQKNSTELVGRRTEMGTDFVVAEECNRYDECGDYMAGYGERVLVIEYRRSDFDKGCTSYPNLSIVLRDVDLVPKGQSGYVYDGC